MKLCIQNGWVCNHNQPPVQQDILIEDGCIAQVGCVLDCQLPDVVDTIDATGLYVIPGLIDMYCRVGEPGYEHEEDMVSASKSAAKGGFTTITCLPNTNPVIDNKTVVDYINMKSKTLSMVNFYPYGSMTKACKGESLAEIGQMVRAGAVGISDAGCSIQNANLMRKILLYSGMFNVPVIATSADASLTGQGVVNRSQVSTLIGLLGIPREAEEVSVARNILLCKYNKSRLHLTHLTTRGAVEMVRRAKEDGVTVTAECSPHYFSLREDAAGSYNTLAKVMPPLRTQDDMNAIIEGLLDGTLDVISSGHTPTTIESKHVEFDKASWGISSLETAFCVSYTELVKTGKLTLPQLVAKMCKNPAQILGFASKGEIRPGFDADLLIFGTQECFTIKGADFASKAKFSPFEGREMYGDVRYTIVNGEVVYLGRE